jgi:adenine-specific DNA glycosylase
VCVRGDDALVVRRPDKGLLGGLMAFPAVRLEPGEADRRAVSRALREVGLQARVAGQPMAEYPFAFTHLRTTHRAYLAEWRRGDPGGEARWEPIAGLDDLAFPTALAPVRAALLEHMVR